MNDSNEQRANMLRNHTQHGTDKEPPEKIAAFRRLLKSISTRLRVSTRLSSYVSYHDLTQPCLWWARLENLAVKEPNPLCSCSG